MSPGTFALIAATMLLTPVPAQAQVAVPVGKLLPRIDKLQPGSRHYVRYFQNADGTVELIDFQTKTVRFDGQQVRITQQWDGPKQTRRLDSLFERGTLRPLTHRRDVDSADKKTREGFRFEPAAVVALGAPDDTNRDFKIATPTPTFNFEIDLEMLQTLPWRAGAAFSIEFYHPGGGPPAPYVFKVAGSERVNFAGEPIDCWVVTTDYNTPDKPLSRFWIAKRSQVVVRVHNPIEGGRAVVKELLPS